jgi:hypothetical protein
MYVTGICIKNIVILRVGSILLRVWPKDVWWPKDRLDTVMVLYI